MASILIAGAGKLGLPLALSLAADGHDVSAVRRSSAPSDSNTISWYHLDLEDGDSLVPLERLSLIHI